MDEIAERIARNITRDYGHVQTDEDLKKHIKEFQSHYGDHTESHLFKYIPVEMFKNKNVLEVGCGFGGGVINLRKNGALAYGVDIDQDAVEIAKMIAKEKGLDPSIFYIGAAENLPFDDETFNIVLSIQVLEHVQDPFKALSEMVRVLKPKGILFIHCPNYLYPWESHYRVHILPLMPKKLAKIYFKLRGRDTQFIDTINYITTPKIERYLDILPVKYENVIEKIITQKIRNPGEINSPLLKQLFQFLHYIKFSSILLNMARLLSYYYSTCVFIGRKVSGSR